MSEITQEPSSEETSAARRKDQERHDMAATYRRLFQTEDGRRVLADLRQKFGLQRLVFRPGQNGRYDALEAAIRDGERRVMSEIEGALLHAEQKF